MLDIAEQGHWIRVNKGDTSCRALADRHYSRQHPGSPQFCRPGRNLVLRTALGNAVWVTWKGIRDDGLDAWECTIFRNESSYLSSELIKEAVDLTKKYWGKLPPDGIITTVDPKKVQSINPGCCFKKAGWKYIGKTKVNKLIILQYKEKQDSRP
jgi:hypothetical protein